MSTLGVVSSCSKVNDIDLRSGSLPVGSECVAAEDSCVGTCIGGTCRAPCGANRECPSDQQCVGDGEAAGCVEANFGKLNLLTGCSEGCQGKLAEFGREGYFYRCETPEELYGLGAQLAFERPDVDPNTLCNSVGSAQFAVKGDRIFELDDNCYQAYLGVADGQLIRHGCLSYMDQSPTTVADVGYLYDKGGETYWLTSPYGGSEAVLFKFAAEAVDEDPKNCQPYGRYFGYSTEEEQAACTANPTFPAIGGVPASYVGFWAECPYTDNGASTNVTYRLPECVTQTMGSGNWTYREDRGTFYPDFAALSLNSEGYLNAGMCSGAVRELASPGLIAVIERQSSTLTVEAEVWELFEQDGAKFLRTKDNNNRIMVYRQMDRPAQFGPDPCQDHIPQLGF